MNTPKGLTRAARIALEVVLVVVALLGGTIFLGVRMSPEPGGPEPSDLAILADLALGLLASVLIPFRKRWPLGTTLVGIAFVTASSFALVALMILVGSLASRRRINDLYIVGPLLLLGAIVPTIGQPIGQIAANVGSSIVSFAIFWLGGAYLGARRALLASAEERALTAEREQSLRVAQAKTAERTRIAQEMHDVLAHRISLIAVHANVLAYREDLTREQTKEHASVVRDAAEKAVAELADVLGVLRGGEGADNAAPPQPTLARLTDLIDDARSAGSPVSIVGQMPDVEYLHPETSRAAFRIIQECLTNARKHATGQPVTVSVTGEEGSHLDLRVSNPTTGAGPAIGGSGMGLTGLAERAEVAGGRLQFGEEDGVFVVRARLKWRNP